jgi:hypothetical protein
MARRDLKPRIWPSKIDRFVSEGNSCPLWKAAPCTHRAPVVDLCARTGGAALYRTESHWICCNIGIPTAIDGEKDEEKGEASSGGSEGQGVMPKFGTWGGAVNADETH